VAQALAAAGAEVNHSDNDGWTALYVAATHGRVEGMRALLAAGADANHHATSNGYTALNVAAWNGHMETTRALLAARAEVNRADHDGWTALCAAAWNGRVEVVRALLAAGTAVNHATNDGWTALYVAAWKGKKSRPIRPCRAMPVPCTHITLELTRVLLFRVTQATWRWCECSWRRGRTSTVPPTTAAHPWQPREPISTRWQRWPSCKRAPHTSASMRSQILVPAPAAYRALGLGVPFPSRHAIGGQRIQPRWQDPPLHPAPPAALRTPPNRCFDRLTLP
jgi:hypothetical protein